MQAKIKYYLYLQIVPVLSFILISWYCYTWKQLNEAGHGDTALLGPTLLLLPVIYVVLPAFFLFELYALWKIRQNKVYAALAPVLLGLLLIITSMILIFSIVYQ